MTSQNQETDTLSSKLKFYSMLLPNEKIDTNPLTINSNSYLSSFFRTIFWATSRNENLKDIKDTTNAIFDILIRDIEDFDSNKLKIEYRLTDIIKLINSGLPNLSMTYDSDRFFKCDITQLIENINNRLFELSGKHPSVKSFLSSLNIKFENKLKDKVDDVSPKLIIDSSNKVNDDSNSPINNDIEMKSNDISKKSKSRFSS